MIQFEKVTKKFGEGPFVLEEVSFRVEPGEFVFLMGESGAGKTTIMRLLTGELRPTSGTIEYLGTDVGKLKSSQLPYHRRTVSVVFQDYKLLPERTVTENIALSLEILGKTKQEIESRVRDLIELVSLQGKEHFFPSQLSGGEAQRVSIARALAVGPKTIFADEPTGNLDWDSSVAIARLLEKIHELGTTILMATHNRELVKLLNKRELHLSHGKMVKDTGVKPSKLPKEKHELKEILEKISTEGKDVVGVEAPDEKHSPAIEKQRKGK